MTLGSLTFTEVLQYKTPLPTSVATPKSSVSAEFKCVPRHATQLCMRMYQHVLNTNIIVKNHVFVKY